MPQCHSAVGLTPGTLALLRIAHKMHALEHTWIQKVGSSDHSACFHCASVGGICGHCWQMSSTVHNTVSACICECRDGCLLTTICQSIPKPIYEIYHRNMLVFDALMSFSTFLILNCPVTIFLERVAGHHWLLNIITINSNIPKSVQSFQHLQIDVS